MKKLKEILLKNLCWLLIALFCFAMFVQSVEAMDIRPMATTHYFSAEVRPGYTTVSRAKCDEAGGYSYIYLTWVEFSNANYAISVWDDNGNNLRGTKIYGTGQASLYTGSQVGKYYTLKIGREYFYDPPTDVSGYWTP